MKAAFVLASAVLLTTTSASAAEAGRTGNGREKFDYWCAPCHAPGPRENGRLLPGTASLQAKYRGEKPGALEERTDLAAAYTTFVIRRGSEGMPFFRKTEISDRDMADIAAYLDRTDR